MIFNSFIYSEISSTLDGSEDYQFREYEYRKRKLNYWNWNDDVLCLGDDCVASSDSDE